MISRGHKGKMPIFIIGNPRSGTTMFRLMLTCHPNIVIPPESGFLITCYNLYHDFQGGKEKLEYFVKDVLNSDKMEEWKIPHQELLNYIVSVTPSSYHELVSGVYKFYSKIHQNDKRRWGDKNNYFLNHIDTIAKLFPDAIFLHLVRDGRDVACSYRNLSEVTGKHAPNLPKSVRQAAIHWRDNLVKIRNSFDTIGWDRVYELRYEDLVTNPEAILQKVCDFIGEDFHPDMLKFYHMNERYGLEPKTFDAWKGMTKQKITTSRVGYWHSDMFSEDVYLYELEAGPMLSTYNYPLSYNFHPIKQKFLRSGFQLITRISQLGKMHWIKRFPSKINKWWFQIRFNSRFYSKLTGKTHVLCFGDSHIRIFRYLHQNKSIKNAKFDVIDVPGATGLGMNNPNSKTDALRIFKNRLARARRFQTLIFLLGEVDTGFVIWYYSEKYNVSIAEQFERSVKNYLRFLSEILRQGFKNIIVLSTPLPTIKDGQDWGEIANFRREISTSQLERTRLTLDFNQRIKTFCQNNNISFLDLDKDLLDSETGLVNEIFINKNIAEHHLENEEYAKIIVPLLKKSFYTLHKNSPE